MENLSSPWYYKRERNDFNNGAVLAGLVKKDMVHVSQPELPLRSPLEIYTCTSQFVLSTLDDRTSPLIGEVTHLMELVDSAQSLNWTEFITSDGLTFSPEIKDKINGEKAAQVIFSVVPDQEELLNPSQRVLLQCYQRCLILKGMVPEKRTRE